MQTIPIKQWHRLATGCGLAAFASYFLAAFAPLPEKISVLLAFAFGPLFMLSSAGLYFVLKNHRDSVNLRIAALFNIVATAMLTLMLVVQLTSQAFHQQYQQASAGSATAVQLSWMFKEVNTIQLGIDLVWDIFISIGTFFFALAMFRYPHMNKLISLFGMLFAALLLGFNLAYFPSPPAESGAVDFGPMVAIWYLLLMSWLLAKRKVILEKEG